MDLYVNVAGQTLKISVPGTMKLVQLIDLIFRRCEKRGICRVDGRDLPKYFTVAGAGEPVQPMQHFFGKPMPAQPVQYFLGKTLDELQITSGGRIEASKTGFYRERDEELSWTVLLHYVTNPRTADIDIARRLLITKIGSGADSYGNTASHFEARLGLPIVSNFKSWQGQINIRNAGFHMMWHSYDCWQLLNNTPFQLAAGNGHAHIVDILLKVGAKQGIKNRDGCTALHLAAKNGHAEIVRKLLDAGAEVGARNIEDETPLHMALHFKPLVNAHQGIIGLLLSAGADVNAKNNMGKTPLIMAVRSFGCGDTNEIIANMVQKLIDAQADLNAQDNRGGTALKHSVWNLDYVSMLVHAGANLNIKDQNGHAPLFYTREPGIKQYLVKNGAEVAEQKGELELQKIYSNSFVGPILEELQGSLFAHLDQLFKGMLPKELTNIIKGYISLHTEREQEILAQAGGRRESLMRSFLKQATHEFPVPPIAETDIRQWFSTLRKSQKFLKSLIRDFLYEKVIKSINNTDIQEFRLIENYFLALTLEMMRDFIVAQLKQHAGSFKFNGAEGNSVINELAKLGKGLTESEKMAAFQRWLVKNWTKENGESLRQLLERQISRPASNQLESIEYSLASEIYHFLLTYAPVTLGMDAASQDIKYKIPQASTGYGGFFSGTGGQPDSKPASGSSSFPPSSVRTAAEMPLMEHMKAELLAVAKLLQKDPEAIRSISNLRNFQEIRDFYDPEALAEELHKMQLSISSIPVSEQGVTFKADADQLKLSFKFVTQLLEAQNEQEGKRRGLH